MTVVEIRAVHRRFGNTRALDGVDLTLRSGEILGIAGPNGAGKSTLTRVLGGEESLDSGEILIDGLPWQADTAGDVVAVVHQEPQVWLNLTLEQNLLVGNEQGRAGVPRVTVDQQRVLERLDIAHAGQVLLERCSLAVQQRTEIARALVRSAKVFLFDEPNSALTHEESQALFQFMHELADSGHVVALVTHRIAEMVEHCDRVVVIRDGRVAAELAGEGLTEAAIAVELVAEQRPVVARRDLRAGEAAAKTSWLSVRGWTDAQGAFRDVALTVERGEVVAIVGVEGSGGRELAASLGGHRPATGDVALAGVGGTRALRNGSAYLSADRREMLFHNMTVGDNLVLRLGRPQIAHRSGWLKRRSTRSLEHELVARYSVRTEGPDQALPALSGGNQQKVAIAAAMAANPALLVIEEPTRGVDIGSKREIHHMLRDFAVQGRAVVAFCTEAPEVFELADRVLVTHRGECRHQLLLSEFDDLEAFAHALATLELVNPPVHTGDREVDGPNVDERKELEETA